jgi:hypothetical protein
MVTIRSGGGISSNKTVRSKSSWKTEPFSKAGNVAGVAQQGMATAFKKEPLTQGRGYEPGKMAATGAPGQYNSALQGPGSQRTVYRSGSQAEYNPGPQPMRTNPMPTGRDTLAEFGPDSVTARGKR